MIDSRSRPFLCIIIPPIASPTRAKNCCRRTGATAFPRDGRRLRSLPDGKVHRRHKARLQVQHREPLLQRPPFLLGCRTEGAVPEPQAVLGPSLSDQDVQGKSDAFAAV